MKKEIGIIGGGPAGIIAAGTAAENNNVTLLEKNDRLGKKLYITGSGRCNITNAIPIDDFFNFVSKNHTFMYSSFYSFTNENIIELLEENGLKTKIERGNRVFPVSDKSSDVLKAFDRYLKNNNVDVRLNSEVFNIEYLNTEEKFLVTTENEEFKFDKLLIATGGASYPGTGSTGDGYNYAKRFGHTIVDIEPSLVPIELNNDWLEEVQGLSLRNVSLKSYSGDRLIYDEFGEMIFTHFGISGPIVLTTSNYISKNNKNIKMYIDLKPALSEEVLNNRILRDFEKYSNKHLRNALNDLLPRKLIPIVIELSEIDQNKEVHQITKEERLALLDAIKNFPLDYKGFRPLRHAIVTSGGVKVDEINPSTMESKIMPGLYFAGELIDVDAQTGGFNLQIAYSTGFIAGSNM